MYRTRLPAAALLVLALLIGATPAAHAVDPFRRSGFSLNRSDSALLGVAADKFLEDEAPPVGTVESWSNPETGNRGTVTLILLHNYKGLPCRRLQHDIAMRGKPDPFRFVIDRCRTPAGEWKIL